MFLVSCLRFLWSDEHFRVFLLPCFSANLRRISLSLVCQGVLMICRPAEPELCNHKYQGRGAWLAWLAWLGWSRVVLAVCKQPEVCREMLPPVEVIGGELRSYGLTGEWQSPSLPSHANTSSPRYAWCPVLPPPVSLLPCHHSPSVNKSCCLS